MTDFSTLNPRWPTRPQPPPVRTTMEAWGARWNACSEALRFDGVSQTNSWNLKIQPLNQEESYLNQSWIFFQNVSDVLGCIWFIQPFLRNLKTKCSDIMIRRTYNQHQSTIFLNSILYSNGLLASSTQIEKLHLFVSHVFSAFPSNSSFPFLFPLDLCQFSRESVATGELEYYILKPYSKGTCKPLLRFFLP